MKKVSILLLLLLCSVSFGAKRLKPVIGKKAYEVKMGDANDTLVIGNSDKAGDFEAHVKMEFWGGEESITLHEIGVKGVPTLENDKIVLDTPKRTFEWFETDEKDLHWVEILKEKPTTNVWSLKISDANQFNYYYQTPFEEVSKRHPGTYVEYFQREGEDYVRLVWPPGGGIISEERPLYIDGSIAVYHKTKKDHIIGQTNYGTGKVLHIPRPKAVDADGMWVWKDIAVKNGVYTETTSQVFLNTATYPVKSNVVYGWDGNGGSSNNWSSEYIASHGQAAYGSDITVVSMNWYGTDRGTNTTCCFGIHVDDGGEPAGKLEGDAESDGFAVTADSGSPVWVGPISLDASQALDGATEYWLSIVSLNGITGYYDAAGGNDTFFDNYATYSNDTDVMQDIANPTDLEEPDRKYSIFADIQAAEGTPGQVITVNIN